MLQSIDRQHLGKSSLHLQTAKQEARRCFNQNFNRNSSRDCLEPHPVWMQVQYECFSNVFIHWVRCTKERRLTRFREPTSTDGAPVSVSQLQHTRTRLTTIWPLSSIQKSEYSMESANINLHPIVVRLFGSLPCWNVIPCWSAVLQLQVSEREPLTSYRTFVHIVHL